MNKRLQNAVIQGGEVYLLLVAAAHFFQIKVPVLFIYFDVPSNVYQDRIIAALAFAAAMFLGGCAKVRETSPVMIRYMLWAAQGLTFILAVNNLIDESFRRSPVYWAGIAFVAAYTGLLHFAFGRRPA